MNPRQRRAILLLALAVLGLLGVFVLVAGYVADVRRQVDPKVTVLALSREAKAHQGVGEDMVKAVALPRQWAPAHALTDTAELLNVVAATDLPPDTVLQEGMLVAPPRLAPRQREMAIMVDAETGVAGKIHADSIVDIIATYGADDDRPDRSVVVVNGARIIDVGVPSAKDGDEVQPQDTAPTRVVPVTFALTPKQNLQVTLAETFAKEVRLALVRPGEASDLAPDERIATIRP